MQVTLTRGSSLELSIILISITYLSCKQKKLWHCWNWKGSYSSILSNSQEGPARKLHNQEHPKFKPQTWSTGNKAGLSYCNLHRHHWHCQLNAPTASRSLPASVKQTQLPNLCTSFRTQILQSACFCKSLAYEVTWLHPNSKRCRKSKELAFKMKDFYLLPNVKNSPRKLLDVFVYYPNDWTRSTRHQQLLELSWIIETQFPFSLYMFNFKGTWLFTGFLII